MRNNVLVALLTAMVVGCAHSGPLMPNMGNGAGQAPQVTSAVNKGPYRLWGEWTWYINNTHDRIDVVPRRDASLPLNALKFLESYCSDCVKILNIKNNGDGTIDVTVRITHPFPDNPEYTGFDVKGIVMLSGSYDVDWYSSQIYPFYDNFHLSWKEAGDAEVLNADGYTVRWNPTWDSGSSLPIFNYWPGKYSHGTPTDNLNAFLNFYTDEQRHMFRVDGNVDRTYHIWLPPGPLTLGYAVEACWEPALNMPVIDPVNDFPYSANQPEPYYVRLILNNNEPITVDCCGDDDCSLVRYEFKQWYGPKPQAAGYRDGCGGGSSPSFFDCPDDPDPTDDLFFMGSNLQISNYCANGKHRGVVVAYCKHWVFPPGEFVYDWLCYFPFDFVMEM